MSKKPLAIQAAVVSQNSRALRGVLLSSVVFANVLLSACEPDPYTESASLSQEDRQASPHSQESPQIQWALPSNDDEALGDPMKIVNNQRSRLAELQDLTEKALKLRPEECDTDQRSQMDGETIPLTIFLPEQPFDFRRYRHARDEASRLRLKEERQTQLAPTQVPVARKIEALGGLVTSYEYVLNALDADVPVCELEKLASLSEIIGFSLDENTNGPGQSTIDIDDVDGVERREALGIPALGHSIFNGSSGSTKSANLPIRFGVIEIDSSVNNTHHSFNNGLGNTRIVDTDDCDFWFPSYRCINSATTTTNSHGTTVTSIILSDFALGQSSSITTPFSRAQRSGIAPRATAHYYRTKNARTMRTAIREAALEDGIDIINMSIQNLNADKWCTSPTENGVREAFEAALDAGVVPVVIAGNFGSDSKPCTVSPFGSYTSTISVGGTRKASSLSSLESVARHSNSSFGSGNFIISGGRNVTSSFVDVVTNYCHKMVAGSGALGTARGCGTSYAAPTIAGVVGLIKHWVSYRGGLPQAMANDPVALRALLSLMADGRASSFDQLGARESQFGYGNVRFVNFDTDLGSEGSWGIRRFSAATGSVMEWNIGNSNYESLNLKGFKAVALADRDNYSQSPDISFQLIDKCHTSGDFAVLTAARSALQWRLRAWESLTPYLLQNRCLWLRATVDAATSPTNVYVAWALYSNDRIFHDASNQ